VGLSTRLCERGKFISAFVYTAIEVDISMINVECLPRTIATNVEAQLFTHTFFNTTLTRNDFSMMPFFSLIENL
jgi:hypothetical protein